MVLERRPSEKLGMNIKGGLHGLPGNPLDKQDEGVFVSKVHEEGVIPRDGRLRVGHRLVEVNGVTLLGATHQVGHRPPAGGRGPDGLVVISSARSHTPGGPQLAADGRSGRFGRYPAALRAWPGNTAECVLVGRDRVAVRKPLPFTLTRFYTCCLNPAILQDVLL